MDNQPTLTEHLERTARDLVLQFTEFELMHDWPALTELGSGVIWIDLASGRTPHDGQTVPSLVVTTRLQAWLRESLSGAGLSKTGTQDASLTAHLIVEHYDGQRRGGTQWAVRGCRCLDGFASQPGAPAA